MDHKGLLKCKKHCSCLGKQSPVDCTVYLFHPLHMRQPKHEDPFWDWVSLHNVGASTLERKALYCKLVHRADAPWIRSVDGLSPG